jgi:hypothetical protein
MSGKRFNWSPLGSLSFRASARSIFRCATKASRCRRLPIQGRRAARLIGSCRSTTRCITCSPIRSTPVPMPLGARRAGRQSRGGVSASRAASGGIDPTGRSCSSTIMTVTSVGPTSRGINARSRTTPRPRECRRAARYEKANCCSAGRYAVVTAAASFMSPTRQQRQYRSIPVPRRAYQSWDGALHRVRVAARRPGGRRRNARATATARHRGGASSDRGSGCAGGREAATDRTGVGAGALRGCACAATIRRSRPPPTWSWRANSERRWNAALAIVHEREGELDALDRLKPERLDDDERQAMRAMGTDLVSYVRGQEARQSSAPVHREGDR